MQCFSAWLRAFYNLDISEFENLHIKYCSTICLEKLYHCLCCNPRTRNAYSTVTYTTKLFTLCASTWSSWVWNYHFEHLLCIQVQVMVAFGVGPALELMFQQPVKLGILDTITLWMDLLKRIVVSWSPRERPSYASKHKGHCVISRS